jgi:DNA polymerase I-like protein with 3'-5' exonuclease and polymerase domains
MGRGRDPNQGGDHNLHGRRRQFYGRTGDEATIREAVAFEPQSVIADTLNQAMLRLWRKGPAIGGIQLLAQIHDAILLQVPDDHILTKSWLLWYN